jgi:Coenzyme PQQ synthesis protein D (PqqD)
VAEKIVGPPRPAVEELEVGADLVLFNGTTNQVRVLNGTASDAWRLSDGSSDESTLVRTLADAYGIDPASIHTQVVQLLASLSRDGFLP